MSSVDQAKGLSVSVVNETIDWDSVPRSRTARRADAVLVGLAVFICIYAVMFDIIGGAILLGIWIAARKAVLRWLAKRAMAPWMR